MTRVGIYSVLYNGMDIYIYVVALGAESHATHIHVQYVRKVILGAVFCTVTFQLTIKLYVAVH